MKHKIKAAVEKFIENWEHKEKIIGIVVCGSHITGNPTKHSDIDLQIILNKNIKWRERGNRIIEGILIEYFANPPKQVEKYMEKEFKSRKQMTAHMFYTGKIIIDKQGEAKRLKQLAKKYILKKYLKADNSSLKIIKYSLWDMQDNLQEVYEAKKGDFKFVYFNYLSNLISNYSEALGTSELPQNKTRRFLEDKKDKLKYKIEDFPDKKFKNMFLKAMKLNKEKEMMKAYEKLTDHVLNKLRGFDIRNYVLKSPIEIR